MSLQLSPQQVHGLVLNEDHCLSFGKDTDETLSVTLIDANHCPGAVMFLFEGYFGRILYTGDFRYSQSLNCEESFARVCSSAVDKLYLDNTFCSPRCDFPSREKAMAEMLRIISDHPDHRVMIGLRKLGKENLLVAIAKYFRTQIFVTEERLRRLELLTVPNVFTVVEFETRINVVNQELIHQRNMDSWNLEMPTLAIIPTALYRVLNINNGLNRGDVFVVPYSDHSSFSELCEFVAAVGPREVIPILTDVKDRLGKTIPEQRDMSCFAEYLDKSPARHFSPPIEFTVIKKDVVRSRPRVTDGSVPGRKSKKFKYKNVVHSKGVVYEHDPGDEESENSAPLTVNDVTVGNTDAWINEQELGKSNGTKKVEEYGLMDETAVDKTNAKYFAESANIWKPKNSDAHSEHETVFRKLAANETANGSNFCQTGSQLVLPLVPSDDRKCREYYSKKLVENEASEYTDCFKTFKAHSDLNLPLGSSLEFGGGLNSKEYSSLKLIGKEVEGNVDSFYSCQSSSEHSVPSITANEHEDLKCIDDSSRYRIGKDIIKVNIDNSLETVSEQTGPSETSNECEDVQKCKQDISLLGIDNNNIGSYSVVENVAVSQLQSGGSAFNNSRSEDILFTTQCSEGDGEVMPGVNHERLNLSDMILQSLQPIFSEEAQSMFQNFLRAQNKH